MDFEITQKILELVSLKITCPMTCEEFKGEFPDDVKGEIQYGKNIAAFLVALNTVGAVSTDRVKEIAGSILGLPIAKGTIISMVSRCADKLRYSEKTWKKMPLKLLFMLLMEIPILL